MKDQAVDSEDRGDVYEDMCAIDRDTRGLSVETGGDHALRLEFLEYDPSLPIWTLRASHSLTVLLLGSSRQTLPAITHFFLWHSEDIWVVIKTARTEKYQDPHYQKIARR
ncbi:hypothetical protein FIBSPDRAFT_947086 [Athelia psychrophila]|uniref:Uncharacterized protein n=1 Tax=Athelia psychrophila TaxID=1759441 RepID=A0A166S6S5_9AGAM|nr:hypothetical protein FIBSPDRAFT_947086 [Fibularhizoctonia sp. CBS 109695]